MHPQTQGKIERYHRSMKTVVKPHNYYCPSELETAIGKHVDYYNNHRYHEALKNMKPVDCISEMKRKYSKKEQKS